MLFDKTFSSLLTGQAIFSWDERYDVFPISAEADSE